MVTSISMEYYLILLNPEIDAKKPANWLCFRICKDLKILSCCLEDDQCRNELFYYKGFPATLILLQ